MFLLCSLSLICSALIAFFYVPASLLLSNTPCSNTATYSPLLYAPLFSLAAVEVWLLLNEGLIIVVSAQGPILKETKSYLFRQKSMPHLIYARIFCAILELLAIVASLVGLFHPLSISVFDECTVLKPRLYFARAVIIFQAVSYLFFLVKVCLYTDPLGLSTPGLLERITLLDNSDGRGSVLISPSEEFDGDDPHGNSRVTTIPTTTEVNVWTHRKSVFNRLNSNDIDHVTKVHNDNINRKKYERKLRALFCCLGVKGQRSRGVALEDVARGLYTVFSETDIVLSDVIAGFSLLREYQRSKKREGGEIALTKKFRMVSLGGRGGIVFEAGARGSYLSCV